MQHALYELGGYREYAAPDDLRSLVDLSWVYTRPDSPADVAHRVLPEMSISIDLRCVRATDGSIVDARLIFSGPSDSVHVFRPEAGFRIEGVRLKTEWCRALLGIDPAEHRNARRALAELAPRVAGTISDRLFRTRSSAEGVTVLENAVRQLYESFRARHEATVAHHALEVLRAKPSMRVATLARAMYVTERHLHRIICSATGIGPKLMQRVGRLNRAVARADRMERPDWAGIALDAGFYDQSHLIDEVRTFTGQTPAQLHAERRAQTFVSEISNTR